MNEELKTWLKDVKFRLRYLHVPQFIFSLLLVFLTPLFHYYAFVPVLNENAWRLTLIMYVVLLLFFISRYAWARLEVLEIKGSKRASGAATPAIFTLLATALAFSHFDRQKERLYVIDTISSIKKSDSTEFYQIYNYHLLYEEAKYKSEYHYEPKTRHSIGVHRVFTYVVCPVILNYMTNYQAETHDLWIGFEFKRGVSKESFTEEDFEDLERNNIYDFQNKMEISYFKECRDPNYLEIVQKQFAPDTDKVEILQAHFDPYEAYDGYSNILTALYILIGAYLFLFLVSLQYEIDHWEQKEILEKRHWKL